MAQVAREQKSEPPVAIAALFIAFLTVSLCGFGGGLAWAHRIAVEQRRWLSEQEFADIVSLRQFMPGPNIVGIAVCVGPNCGAGLAQPPRSAVSSPFRGELAFRLVRYSLNTLV
jgi:hypothetical protein